MALDYERAGTAPENRSVRVLLVDDDPIFREGMKLLLETNEIEVVAEARDGSQALWCLEHFEVDVVLMDLRMPVVDGVTATRRIVMRPKHPPVVSLTTFDDEELVFEALRAGAVGYLLKDACTDEIMAALRSAIEGASVITPTVMRKVVEEFARVSRLCPARPEPEDANMTPREFDVLELLVRGASNKEIAAKLEVGEGTVKNHLTSVYRKLGVADRVQAVIAARQCGIS